MNKHDQQIHELTMLTMNLIKDMNTWPAAMTDGIEILKNSCCVEVYLRASALVFQAMASMTACKKNADPEDVAISRALVAASKRALEITNEPVLRSIAMASDGTIN